MPYKNAADRLGRQCMRAWAQRTMAIELLGGVCIDCGTDDPLVLHFDHIDRNEKSFDLGKMFGRISTKKLLPEIQKCELRCRECHWKKTRSNGEFYTKSRGVACVEVDDDEWDALTKPK